MIPGFVIAYRDKSNKVVLYFYPGYDDDLNKIYADIDTSKIQETCNIVRLVDGAIKYTFDNSNITSITCKLIENKTNIEHIEAFRQL